MSINRYSFLRNCFFCVLLVLIFCELCAQESRHPIGIVVAKSGLNLRQGPSLTARTIVTMPAGAQAKVLGQKQGNVNTLGINGQWVNIQYGDKNGWALAAHGHLALTFTLDEKLFVAKDEGLSILNAPLPSAPLIAHAPYGGEVRVLTEGFQSDDTDEWIYVEFKSHKGYVAAGALTTVSYPLDQLSSGPFEGMVFIALPNEYSWGMGDILDSRYGIPENWKKNKFSILELRHRKKRYTVLLEFTRPVGDYRESRILQVIQHSHYPGMLSQFDADLRGATDSIECYSANHETISNGQIRPLLLSLAFLDMKKSKGRQQPDGSIKYLRIVRKAWIFDAKTERLREVPPAGAWCFFYPFTG